MFGLGMPELVVVLVIALLIFGAGRLPEIGNSLGKAIRGFRESTERRDPEPPPEPPKVTGRSCPQCGAALAADARFCGGCGKQVNGA
jgi:sec-independent protein translocase protein TatA